MVVAVVGLGLIGGSILRGLAASGLTDRLLGFDTSVPAVDHFRELGLDAYGASELSRAEQADLWVVATPPRTLASVLDEVAALRQSDSVVTDVASIKGSFRDSAAPIGSHFVGGHPIAGKSASHHSLADPDLFVDAPWALCDDFEPSREVRHRVETMVYALDAQPIWMSSEEHDRHLGLLSHLPHILAAVLLHQSLGLSHVGLGGGSWRDLTRVGGNYAELWAQILPQNREHVRAHLAALKAKIEDVDALLAAGSDEELEAFLTEADRIRRGGEA
ncbi:MAG: prephenate dehydrogenase/arogenate dehydrogenase family protein [Chthonomonas sp.]|nr:prephenate dehydrogenase/arogenate dehydrogenase family protein [Chthonomonas sp.]